MTKEATIMTNQTQLHLDATPEQVPGSTDPKDPAGPSNSTDRVGAWRRIGGALSFRNISAIYILAALVVIYSIWVPDTFLTATTWRTLLDGQAIVALAAVALALPLAAGVFNLAIGTQIGLGGILVAQLLTAFGLPTIVAILITLVVGALIGLVMAILIVNARIDSFIATLGVSSLLAAAIMAISGGKQILDLPDDFSNLGIGNIGGVTYPVIVLIVIALLSWYILERTPVGRRVYATGGNPEAARLAGVNTTAVVFGVLIVGGALAALAGVLVSARLGNADPTIGPGYLLPAFSAAFLGSTQFRGGRFNIWGTVLAVYVLAVGVKGLQLGGAPVWIPDAFNGAALLLAVAMAKFTAPGSRVRGDRWQAVRQLLRWRGVRTPPAA